ncbi:MAG: GtrA family protein [Clostridia bacterium]|nr:GtrA family protein [Clostridia bacterium]MBR5992149.1 GtrA family protein [Clostridia bacterium]MBR6479907.1 GtrA family protein [Clostridia bacterium]MBR6512273.1 GtrA family protein [Clostridia bacterium]
MSEKKNTSLIQAIKFFLFSCSAGLIQAGSFTFINEVVIKLAFFQNLMAEHPGFAAIMHNKYGPIYLTALTLSVLWNFTFNRKFTFKSASNVPIAMLKVLGYYAVFTPVSTILGNHFTAGGANEYIVLGLTMACNLITEFLFDKFVVFRDALGKE